jgi:Phospholipase_D-nuclease N-terminal
MRSEASEVLRAIPLILALVLAVYSVVDVVQAERHLLRPLGRIGWLAVVLLVPILGPLVWILTGRMRESAAPAGPTSYPREPRVLAPEDDPEFLRQMRELDSAHEQLLKQWEDDLRRREQGLRKDDDEEPPETGGSPAK